ncbi:MAG: ATP-dependent DNA ligase, partial [Caulobacteraceae bacterium]
KWWRGRNTGAARFAVMPDVLDHLPVRPGAEPMEARAEPALPDGADWAFEPKFDGFRCLAFREGASVALRAKSGKPLERYFPEVAARLAALPLPHFVLDGELVIEPGAFAALQMRLHPAESRVRRLARETPATYVLFDLLVSPAGLDLSAEPLGRRRGELERLYEGLPDRAGLRLSPMTFDRTEAEGWLSQAGAGPCDGVVAKRLSLPYRFGERAMVKVKRRRTADCVVGGFRYLKDRPEVGSLLLGLYDDAGRLDHVGFTSQIAEAERADLTRRLQGLAGPPGFTGAAPGGPSRWNSGKSAEWVPLKPALVVEVAFDQTSGRRLRHGARLLRWRPDKAPSQCRMDQLAA